MTSGEYEDWGSNVAPEGTYFMGLEWRGADIAQTLSTVPGQTYNLTYYAAAHKYSWQANLTVYAGSQLIFSVIPPEELLQGSFQRYAASFTATSNATEIKFENAGPDSIVFLDSIGVSCPSQAMSLIAVEHQVSASQAEDAEASATFTYLGTGYCGAVPYASTSDDDGNDPDAASLEACQSACANEPQCVSMSWTGKRQNHPGAGCSRYTSTCSRNGVAVWKSYALKRR